MRLLDNTDSTDKAATTGLKPGRYLIELHGVTATTAVISIFRRPNGGAATDDMPVASGGSAVTLTKDDSAKEITNGSGDIVVQRATGTDFISVDLTRIPY